MHSLEKRIEDSRTASERWKSGQFPEKMYHVFREYLERHRTISSSITFVDVGAAEGCYTCSVIEHYEKFNILSFEPELTRLNVYEENLNYYLEHYHREPTNVSVNIHEKLVMDGSDSVATLRHYFCRRTGEGAGSSTTVKSERPNRIAVDVKYEAVRLDDFIHDYDEVDAMKIDVEGAEILVLKGAKNFIEKFNPIIFLEIHGGEQFGSITRQMVEEVLGTFKVPYELRPIELHRSSLEYYIAAPSKKGLEND